LHHTPSTSPRGAATAIAALLIIVLGNACASRPSGAGPGALSAAPAEGVMTARDRARLEAVARERADSDGNSGYVIGPDDLLEIRVPDLLEVSAAAGLASAAQSGALLPVVAPAPVFEQGLRVNAAGKVTLPFIGTLTAEGQTPSALEQEVARRITEAQILRSPHVSIQIIEFRSRVIAVVGSVERPGLYPLTRPGATVGDMIWAAGGPTKDAGRVVQFAPATVGRRDPGDAQAIRIDLEALLHANGVRDRLLDPRARAGDVITIAPAGSVLVDGWVSKPGSYPVTRNLTVNGAVAAAGGKLFPADLRNATVARVTESGSLEVFPVDLEAVAEGRAPDLPIIDGDVLRIPASTPLVPPWAFWTLLRDMVRFSSSAPVY
jgi:protein involved in polysaccharide export with SLBB domain